jgi:hypothetical protein
MKPAPGQYWRSLREPEDGDDLPKGALVLITEVDDAIHFVSGKQSFIGTYEEEGEQFEDDYEFVPDGREQQAKRFQELVEDLQTMEPEIPKLLPLAQDGFSVDETALTVSGDVKPDKVRRAVATARNEALKFKRKMLDRQKELKALFAEQEHALQAKVNKLNAMVKIAAEAIWTIELYLGRFETIKQLRGGKAAPKSEKIVVRQLVLNMDEECAVAAKEGGIDTHEVDEFDKWVKVEKNLQQVLPEPKGIVAFHVRGEKKAKGDPYAVSKTYFLIRNGARLYRVCTNLIVRDVLFPKAKEFDEFFFSFEHDWDTHETLKKPLRPGSHSYMAAMKKVDKRRRHYLRILLFMQGLIDRTKVFKPLPSPQVNLCDMKQHKTYLRFLRDAEMLLSDGRARFNDWLHDINSRMEIGMRVIGEFNSYHIGARDLEYRSHPRGHRPDNHTLFTIERRHGDSFVILFPYKNWHGDDHAKRASFRVHTSDDFVINFDLVTEADIDYYLSNRLDRSDYTKMFPLLKCVRRLKRRETKEEAPFRKLLIGEIVKAHGVKVEKAAARVDHLISWWKYKNKTHRALTSDDAKAIRMIVKEFRLERERANDLREQEELVDPVVKALRKAVKDAIYIGHRKGNQYVTIAPMNTENLFVCEQVWRLSKRTGLEETASREWTLLDKRCQRWQKLWATDRWPKIKIGVRRENVLTDPEIKEAVKWGFANACQREREETTNRWAFRRNPFRGKKYFRFLPLAATWHREKYTVRVYYSTHRSVLPSKKRLLTSGSAAAPLCYQQVSWTRKLDKLTFHKEYDAEIDRTIKDPPWKVTKQRYNHEADEHTTVLKLFPANIKVLETEGLAYDHIKPERTRLKHVVSRARMEVEQRVKADLIEAEHQRFRDDLKDETMWKAHLKSKNIQHPHMHELEAPFKAVVETGTKLGGKTLAAVLKKAKTLKHPIKHEENDEELPKGFKFSKDVDVEPPEEDEEKEYAEVPDEIDDDDDYEIEDDADDFDEEDD